MQNGLMPGIIVFVLEGRKEGSGGGTARPLPPLRQLLRHVTDINITEARTNTIKKGCLFERCKSRGTRP